MRFDVTTFGELVIDLVPVNTAEGLAYLPKPGGAPANVAAGVSRLGRRSAMISRVGREAFGRAAVAALAQTGVDVGWIGESADGNTALAVVTLTEANESDFFFYRENCADSRLAPEDVPEALIAASAVLHVGTLSLATPRSAQAQRHAIALAREAGALVSADLNFRPAFWADLERMRAAGSEVVRAANVVKLSAEELALLAGSADRRAAVRSLWHPKLRLLAVTEGAAGAELFTPDDHLAVPGFAVAAVDTVGCGDAFMACLLCDALDYGFRFERGDLKRMARRACAAGAVMAARRGAMENMPDRTAITGILRTQS